MRAVLALRRRHPDIVVAGLGIHPQIVPYRGDEELEEAFAFLAAHLEQADVLGEVGLDFKHARTEAEQARQAAWLERQLELAAAHRKPVNLHSRRALRQVMNHAIAYRERTGLGALLHWFTHSAKLVRATNAAGVYVSAGPTTLFDAQARAVAATIDDHLLLLETDCPVPYRGESARPAWVMRVLAGLAEARGTAVDELAARVADNFACYLAGASGR
jgi:TatD DNase family protein